MNYTYQFKVWVFDPNDNSEETKQGFLVATDFVDATHQLFGYFDDAEVTQYQLKYVSECSLIFIPGRMNIKEIVEENEV